MTIDGTIYNATLNEILVELQTQLHLNNIPLINDIKDSGDNVQTNCPYHKGGQERKPSFGIHKETGACHCFTCGETHTFPEVISYCFGYNDFGIYGRQWLLKNFAAISVEDRKDIKLDFIRNNRTNDNSITIESRQFVSEEELDSYRYYHPYWAKRGITSEWLIELFDLGYDNATQCITFPVRDEKGNCLFVARRSVNIKYFNYPKNAEKNLYGYWELLQLEEFPKTIIICESMLDCLSFWEAGKYAIALNGLGSSKQFEMLNNMPCRKFILATDMDDAGLKARKVLRKKIKGKLITEYILPKGKKDANECTIDELLELNEIF